MKRIFVLLLTLPFFVTHGQETGKKIKPGRLSIGFNFSPDYSSRVLVNNGGGNGSGTVINTRNKFETAKLGYTGGINLSMNSGKRLRFETGIQYSNKGYQTKNQDLVYPPPPDPVAPKRAKFIYNYNYIDIPFKIHFILRESKWRWIAGAGLTANFLVEANGKSIFEYADGKTDERTESSPYEFKKFNLSPLLSLGLETRVSDKLWLGIEPTIRFGLLKTMGGSITEHLWNAGLNISLRYTIARP